MVTMATNIMATMAECALIKIKYIMDSVDVSEIFEHPALKSFALTNRTDKFILLNVMSPS